MFGSPLLLPLPSPPGWTLLTLLTARGVPPLAPEYPHLFVDGLVPSKGSAPAAVRARHRQGSPKSRQVLSQFWKLDVQDQGADRLALGARASRLPAVSSRGLFSVETEIACETLVLLDWGPPL